MSVADLRQKYGKFELLESGMAGTPFEQFTQWFAQALEAGVAEPNAMTLATVGPDQAPSARIVLLKGFDENGFVFYTNYESRKGRDLAAHPQAALLFFWQPLERQVRIEGRIEKTTAEESDAYFRSRPLGSRIGAWVSPQSQPISREALEARNAELTAQLGDDPQRPPHWGGYRVVPHRVEFWQGRPSRLHDRLAYELQGDAWVLQRLAP
ncbi:pyridoxamine 5'-phosphate oxidase [Yanghanlia caeni]|uniref:Pyridoxine/pyridoxamine 5'-phosphate oxidase n=1 Tax=Yanghanlia caeni TaxID=3064283 RepID=A0ABU1D761_9BURK|nr:pyridoxamine 5'-phosphate oxidase [Alcaligenaceae bacterium LG-2]NGR09157.1 pyridoxamine 5'-phosphate oxidase [bacterium SGD-2]